MGRGHWWTLVKTAINLLVEWTAETFLTRITTVSFSKRTLFHELVQDDIGALYHKCHVVVWPQLGSQLCIGVLNTLSAV
jgi:hypothetical protein